jgi:hypothetical protein
MNDIRRVRQGNRIKSLLAKIGPDVGQKRILITL